MEKGLKMFNKKQQFKGTMQGASAGSNRQNACILEKCGEFIKKEMVKMNLFAKRSNCLSGKEVNITGNVVSDRPVSVSCAVFGDVTGNDSVIVYGGAHVTGNVSAQTLVVSGAKITGNVQAKSVYLKNRAVVIGDINTETIDIEEGSLFCGQCKTSM